MRGSENSAGLQQQSQIELQVRQVGDSPESLKFSDRSTLLQRGVTPSDGFVSLFESSGHSPADRNGSQSSALEVSESFVKLVGDDRPLLASNDSFSGGEEDRIESSSSKGVVNGGASVRSAIFNLSTTIIGAGIMALPAAVRILGILPGVVMFLVIGICSVVTLEMVVRYSTSLQAWTYSQMVAGHCGKAGRLSSQICIIVGNGGVLIVYMIIMGDVLSGSKNHVGLFEGWMGSKGWWTNRSLVLLLTMVFVLAPLSFFKRLKSLEISSGISVALALLFVLLSCGIAFIKLVQGKLGTRRLWPSFESKKDVLDILTVVPIVTNAFGCQFNVPNIYSELRERTAPTMNRVCRISIGLCVVVYTSTGLSGYLLFGELTDSDVMSNFDTDLGIAHSRFWNDVIRLGYVVHLFFVFPVIHFSLRENLNSLVFPQARALPESSVRFAGLTLVQLTVIYTGSTWIPNIWVAFEFTGATTGIALAFILPSLVAIQAKGGGKMEQKFAWVIMLVAVVLSVVGVTTQIYSFADGESL